jgi:hypothetical protein
MWNQINKPRLVQDEDSGLDDEIEQNKRRKNIQNYKNVELAKRIIEIKAKYNKQIKDLDTKTDTRFQKLETDLGKLKYDASSALSSYSIYKDVIEAGIELFKAH